MKKSISCNHFEIDVASDVWLVDIQLIFGEHVSIDHRIRMNRLINLKYQQLAVLLLLRTTLARMTGLMPMVDICTLCLCTEDTNNEEITVECVGSEHSVQLLDLKGIVWPVAKDNTSGPLKVRAHFRDLQLHHLPKISTRAKLVELTFENTATDSLPHEPFERFTALESLTISGNKLSTIEKDFFASKNNLKYLDLSNNSMVAITALERASFEQLEYVDLSHNNFKFLSENLIQALENASTVRLHHCNIYNWDSVGLLRWKFFDVSWNKLTVVSGSTFSNLHHLTTLYLAHNEIQFVDPQAFVKLGQLEQLDLSHNFITNLAGNLFLAQSLHFINMAANNLDVWPFAKIPQAVQKMDIQDNKLTDLNLGQTVNISILNASNNQLEAFFGNSFPGLIELDLSDNLLNCLPQSLGIHLRKLILDGNPLKIIFFEHRISLELLSLNRLPNLEELEAFSFWKLVGPEDDKERDCVEIRISHCPKLRLIAETAFDNTNLCKLDLSYNQLTFLPENLTDWQFLRGEINLQGNPWDCSCSRQWMVDEILPMIYENEDLQYLLEDFRCAAPESRKDNRLVKYLNNRGAFCGGSQLARLVDVTKETSQAGFLGIGCSDDDEVYCLHVHKGSGLVAFCLMVTITVIVSIVIFTFRSKREVRHSNYGGYVYVENNYYDK